MYSYYLYDLMFIKFFKYLAYCLDFLLPFSNVMRNIFSIIPLISILYCVSSSLFSPSSEKNQNSTDAIKSMEIPQQTMFAKVISTCPLN